MPVGLSIPLNSFIEKNRKPRYLRMLIFSCASGLLQGRIFSKEPNVDAELAISMPSKRAVWITGWPEKPAFWLVNETSLPGT